MAQVRILRHSDDFLGIDGEIIVWSLRSEGIASKEKKGLHVTTTRECAMSRKVSILGHVLTERPCDWKPLGKCASLLGSDAQCLSACEFESCASDCHILPSNPPAAPPDTRSHLVS